jgi:hypothetical protein
MGKSHELGHKDEEIRASSWYRARLHRGRHQEEELAGSKDTNAGGIDGKGVLLAAEPPEHVRACQIMPDPVMGMDIACLGKIIC